MPLSQQDALGVYSGTCAKKNEIEVSMPLSQQYALGEPVRTP